MSSPSSSGSSSSESSSSGSSSESDSRSPSPIGASAIDDQLQAQLELSLAEATSIDSPDVVLPTVDGREMDGGAFPLPVAQPVDVHPCRTYEISPLAAAIHPADIYSAVCSENFRCLITGGADGIIRKWDFHASMNGQTPLTQAQRHGQVESVTKAGVMLTSWANEDATPSETGARTAISISPVYSLAIHPEAVWILSGTESGGINLYTARTDEGQLHHTMREHTSPVSALSLSHDAFECISGSWDKQIIGWDLNTGGVARRFIGATSQIATIDREPASLGTHRILTASMDGQVMLWDDRDASFIGKFAPPEKTPPWCLSACWSADGSKIYVGRRNGTVDEWDVRMGRMSACLRLPVESGPVHYVHALPSNSHLVCASMDNLRLWDLSHNPTEHYTRLPPFRVLPGHHGGIISTILSDAEAKFMISTSGARGWEGVGNHGCLLYDVKTVL